MLTCPHGRGEIVPAELSRPSLCADFAICPHCEDRITVDAKTKRRQAIAIGVAIVSLVFTLLLYFDGIVWLVPAIVTYVILGALICSGDKRVHYVPYQESDSDA